MTVDGENPDFEESPDHRQGACRSGLGTIVVLIGALASGCAIDTRHSESSGRISGDAEAELPPTGALASGEDSDLAADATVVQPPPMIWQRLRAGYQFDRIHHKRIDAEVRRLRRSPGAFFALMTRTQPYLHHILDAVTEANLPTELALLPAIESGFRPHAYSPDGASGLWQFMPATGRMMGLQQDWWFDRRRALRASTTAAIAYLKALNARFDGDWLHTLAAYNAGATKVKRAIRLATRRGEKTDFWSLDLPGETDRYVPRLLALARVVNEPHTYGLTLPEIPDEPYFSIANTAGQIDLNVAANIAGMPVEELLGLNAGHRRWATRPDGPHELLLPKDKAGAFEVAVSSMDADQRLRWQRHRIRPGDNLNRIAREYGVTATAIRHANGLKDSRIRAGKDLMIPLSDLVTMASGRSNQQGRQRLRYRVRKGDSLYTIARRFQVSVKDLKRWNRVGRYIRPGEQLTVFIDPDA
jgi:membrane-bound lytic murein transglycosylase D